MELNLQVLAADLAPISFESCLANKAHELTCAHPVLFVPGMDLRPRAVYVARAEDLPSAFVAYAPFDLVCIGRPSSAYLVGQCNVIWCDADAPGVDPLDLFASVCDVFDRYEGWCAKMERVLAEGRPVREIGTVSLPILGNPFYVQGPGFRNVFYALGALDPATSVVDVAAYRASLVHFRADEYVSLEGYATFSSDPAFAAAYASDEPTYLPDGGDKYPCGALFRNIGPAANPVGRLFVDEVCHTIAEKDVALTTILAHYLFRALAERPAPGFSRASGLLEAMEGALFGKSVDARKVAAALEGMGWREDDRFACLVAEPASRAGTDAAVVARRLHELHPHVACVPVEGRWAPTMSRPSHRSRRPWSERSATSA